MRPSWWSKKSQKMRKQIDLDPVVNRLEDAIKTLVVTNEQVGAAFRNFATFVRQQAGRSVTDDELLSFLAWWIVTNPMNRPLMRDHLRSKNPTHQQIVSFFEILHQTQR